MEQHQTPPAPPSQVYSVVEGNIAWFIWLWRGAVSKRAMEKCCRAGVAYLTGAARGELFKAGSFWRRLGGVGLYHARGVIRSARHLLFYIWRDSAEAWGCVVVLCS